MRRRIISILLIAALLATSAACGNQADDLETSEITSEAAALEPANENGTDTTESTEEATVSEHLSVPESYEYCVVVSINPHITLYINTVDGKEVITNWTFDNQDAEDAYSEIDFSTLSIDDAVSSIITTAADKGYLKEDGKVELTVINNTAEVPENNLKEIREIAEKAVENTGIKAAVTEENKTVETKVTSVTEEKQATASNLNTQASEEAAQKATEEAAAKKAADEVAQKAAEEAAAKKAADEAAQKAADEEAAKKAEEEARLRERTAKYNAAYTQWQNRKPQASQYMSDEYNELYTAWQNAKPDQSKYVKSGKYATQADATAAYNTDYTSWENNKPAYTEADCDQTAFSAAKTAWQNAEPQLTSYGLKKVCTDNVYTYVLAGTVDPSVAVTITLKDGYALIDNVYYKAESDSNAYALNNGYAVTEDGVLYSTEAVDTTSYNVPNDGYIEIDGIAYRKATADEAYAMEETINDGYIKTADGVYYENTEAADSDAYTITEEVLKSGYAKQADGSYIKIVDKSEATQAIEGTNTYELENGTTVYYYSDDRLDLQQNENEIFASRESQRTDVTEVNENGNIFYYDANKPDYQETMSREDFEKLIGWGGTEYNATKYYIWDDGSDTCRLYKKLTYDDITIPEKLKDGIIRTEIGEYYKYRNEPKTEIKDHYYFDETNNRYYTDATPADAVATPYSKVLKSGYVEVDGKAYKIVTSDEAATYTRILKSGYVEKNGAAYTESDKTTAATESVNSGYYAVTEDGVVVYYMVATGSNSELRNYNNDYEKWVNSEPIKSKYPTADYTQRLEAWKAAEPDEDSEAYSYGITPYKTQQAADEKYEEDMAAWEAAKPVEADYFDSASYESAIAAWKNAEPKLADF